jgi:hypothetical protein
VIGVAGLESTEQCVQGCGREFVRDKVERGIGVTGEHGRRAAQERTHGKMYPARRSKAAGGRTSDDRTQSIDGPGHRRGADQSLGLVLGPLIRVDESAIVLQLFLEDATRPSPGHECGADVAETTELRGSAGKGKQVAGAIDIGARGLVARNREARGRRAVQNRGDPLLERAPGPAAKSQVRVAKICAENLDNWPGAGNLVRSFVGETWRGQVAGVGQSYQLIAGTQVRLKETKDVSTDESAGASDEHALRHAT